MIHITISSIVLCYIFTEKSYHYLLGVRKMNKQIDLNKTLLEICSQYPEIIPTMQELGFDKITNPGMLQTAGRVMTIPNGCRLKGISIDIVKATLHEKGFTFTE